MWDAARTRINRKETLPDVTHRAARVGDSTVSRQISPLLIV
jgi:hypothetical protein